MALLAGGADDSDDVMLHGSVFNSCTVVAIARWAGPPTSPGVRRLNAYRQRCVSSRGGGALEQQGAAQGQHSTWLLHIKSQSAIGSTHRGPQRLVKPGEAPGESVLRSAQRWKRAEVSTEVETGKDCRGQHRDRMPRFPRSAQRWKCAEVSTLPLKAR